jgi:hypothetical protein
MKTKQQSEVAAQYESIERQLAALRCDYYRLAELKNEREKLVYLVKYAQYTAVTYDNTEIERAREVLTNWETDNAEELVNLEDAAGECTDKDAARDNIQSKPLEIKVRSCWTNPDESLNSDEFIILLCTGGHAVRIRGELTRGEPCDARIEYQDWCTSWTPWHGANSDTLCEFAANFFFGE